MLGHRTEKCRNRGEPWDKELVMKFGISIENSTEIGTMINTYIDIQRKNEIDFRIGKKK